MLDGGNLIFQDILSEALLCFGANSASMDEIESSEELDDVSILQICMTSITSTWGVPSFTEI